eukprot:TRINITY_DN621_c0_g1_i3.p1 TRINITY_DN621_c0_g1~~TRINITY_DN621_c0_g1_i3.p1  ORF type:complete len:165 (+),score=27.01 TRINITY_DN621_c0_g1_i3:63-497(+)
MTGHTGAEEKYREYSPCCEHNNWDNVRVSKKIMTLRCRVCQKQWRAHVEEVWFRWKCPQYAKGNTCSAPDCPKLHINYRKQGLEVRFETHGPSVIEHVRVGKAQQDVQDRVDKLRAQSKPVCFTHCPYSWGVEPEFDDILVGKN